MSPSQFWIVRTVCMIFGIFELLGSALWCAAGAGIYGSPLAGMSQSALIHIGAFLVSGPVSAFLAGMLAWRRPHLAGVLLFAGGVVSGVLALPYLLTDAFILPFILVSVPMVLLGRGLLRSVDRQIGIRSNPKPLP